MPSNLVQDWWLLPFAALLSTVFCLVFAPLADKAGLVDHPGERKVHDSVTPLVGGLAIFLALLVCFASSISQYRFFQALAGGALVMVVLGMMDDRRHLSPAFRFLVQVFACLVIIIYSGVQLDDFGRLFADKVLTLGWLAWPVTIFSVLGVINAFNMIDGMDGLSGTIYIIAAAGMAVLAVQGGQDTMAWLLFLSICSVSGFLLLNARLPWNKKARVFLGDGGTMLLGFMLAWSFVTLGNDHNEAGARAFMPMTAVWLIAVPLLDTTTLMWRRWKAGNSAFVADQHHFHHAFLRAGFTVGQTWWMITLLALTLAAAGMAFEWLQAPEYLSFYLFIVVAFAYYFYMKNTWFLQQFLGRDFIYNEFDK